MTLFQDLKSTPRRGARETSRPALSLLAASPARPSENGLDILLGKTRRPSLFRRQRLFLAVFRGRVTIKTP
jgi:hypothetical protein